MINYASWDDKRQGELTEFSTLLLIASKLDRSSGCLQNIKEYIRISNELIAVDLNGKRKSFCAWVGMIADEKKKMVGKTLSCEKESYLGKRVVKRGGDYTHTGTVVSVFEKKDGKIRAVVEFDPPTEGLLHIFSMDQLELI